MQALKPLLRMKIRAAMRHTIIIHYSLFILHLRNVRSFYSSSNLSTAMNASEGICTVPRLRIFFLPAP